MVRVHVTVGALAYIGLFASTIDAILDAMDRFGDANISARVVK